MAAPVSTPWAARSDTPAASRYDLFTTLLHELGHLLGFTPDFTGYVRLLQPPPPALVGPSLAATLNTQTEHLGGASAAPDLMGGTLRPGERRWISSLDAAVIRLARLPAPPAAASLTLASPDPAFSHAVNGPASFGLHHLGAAPGPGLLNGRFDLADPAHAGFGWQLNGGAEVRAGQGVLFENGRAVSRFAQTFTLPTGATALRFTLKTTALTPNHANPPDAFEVALRDASTGASVVGVAQGLSGTDAFLNLQTDRQFTASATVQTQPLIPNGGTVPANTALVVTVDLSPVTPGATVTLEFDLLAFDPSGSEITLDDVQILAGPPLDFWLDPVSDSGVAGDDRTRHAQVQLTGATLPGLPVRLDYDGDGFDDGQAVADARGQFLFEQVPLVEGPNLLRVQVDQDTKTTTVERTIVLDRQGPTLTGFSLNGGEAQRSRIASWTFEFSEDLGGSLDPSDLFLLNQTLAAAIPTASFVVTPEAPHRFRITMPTLPGQALPDGNYVASLLATGITDLAGNPLGATVTQPAGQDARTTFHAYYGDIDGDRDVDFFDLYHFRRSYGTQATDAAYVWYLDFERDGRIEDSDLDAYQPHYLTRLEPAAVLQMRKNPRSLAQGQTVQIARLANPLPVSQHPESEIAAPDPARP